MVQQKGTEKAKCSSVGKGGMEAHFVNEGISIVRIVQSGKEKRRLCSHSIQLHKY